MSRFDTTYSSLYIPPCLDCEDQLRTVRTRSKESLENNCKSCTNLLKQVKCSREPASKRVTLAVESLENIDCKSIASRVLHRCRCVQQNCCCHEKENFSKESIRTHSRCCKFNTPSDKKNTKLCACQKDSCQRLQRARESRIKSIHSPVCRCRAASPIAGSSRNDNSLLCVRKIELEKLRDEAIHGRRPCRCRSSSSRKLSQ
uniref:Uncharacterized protein n=1 Tax=Anopheles farauti TaxID=69004 RepID=A0A182QEF4_9DIPT